MCHVVFYVFRRLEPGHGAGRRTSIRRIGDEAPGSYGISRAPNGGLGPKPGSCAADVLDCGVRKSGSGLCGASVCRIPLSVRRTCPRGRCSSPPLHASQTYQTLVPQETPASPCWASRRLRQAKRIVSVPHLIQQAEHQCKCLPTSIDATLVFSSYSYVYPYLYVYTSWAEEATRN